MVPKIGDRVFVRLKSPNKWMASVEHVARIADADEDLLHLEIPISTADGRFLRLVPKDRLSICFLKNGVPHNFDTEVVGFREDVIRLVSVKAPEPGMIRKAERRNFLRVPAMLDVDIRLEDEQQFSAVTHDIGGGGLCFVCDKTVPLGPKDVFTGRVQLKYRNGTADVAIFKAHAIRIEEMKNRKKKIVCYFSNISENERQKVIRYCLERQLEFRE